MSNRFEMIILGQDIKNTYGRIGWGNLVNNFTLHSFGKNNTNFFKETNTENRKRIKIE